jgi:DegV family protein with EDD domain
MKIAVVTGSDSDLPPDLITKHSLLLFPFGIVWNPLDDVSDLYSLMRNAKELNITDAPKTSQPSVQACIDVFTKALDTADEIIVVTVSSALSGTFNVAQKACNYMGHEKRKRIHVFDSESSSCAEGLLILQLVQYVNENKKLKDILTLLEEDRKNIHVLGTFDDPTWLARSGRLNPVQLLIVKNMLKAGFRPLLTLKDKKIVNYKIQKNAYNKADAIAKQFFEEIASLTYTTIHVAITHGDCLTDAKDLQTQIEKLARVKIEFVSPLSSVVGAHLGPDSLLLSWIAE